MLHFSRVEADPKQIKFYLTEDGKAPFTEWLKNLRDREARAKIKTRLDRAEDGNVGECNSVGAGVQEMKINYGPGYRVYFGYEGNAMIILLCGGDKSTQSRDIKKAQQYWSEYQRR